MDASTGQPEIDPDGVWKALSDPTRRAILDLLREGRSTTGDLAGAFPALSRFAVMKHLSVLEDAGLVISRKEGRQKFNYLNAVPLRRVYERWVGRYQDRWAGSLVGLQRLAESEHERVQEKSTMPMETITVAAAVVQTEVAIDAPPEKVYDLFFDRAHDWFYESDEKRQTVKTIVERKLGGHFYFETQRTDGPPDQNVLGTITMLKPGRKIRMRGDCTVPSAFIANMTITFEPADSPSGGGTRVSVEHRMAGEYPDDLPTSFEEGWQDGLQKLKALAEG
ncbi:MAG: metalloregulator ArsR/SmtB family transcription factor [Phycisphaerales bacterium JB060]